MRAWRTTQNTRRPTRYRRAVDTVTLARLLSARECERLLQTRLEDVLLPDELFSLPARQKAELCSDETDLARPAPDDRRRAGERDELVQLDKGALERPLDERLLDSARVSEMRCHSSRTSGRERTSSSSVKGICKAIRLGRNVASARIIRRMSFFSKLLAGASDISIRSKGCIDLGGERTAL